MRVLIVAVVGIGRIIHRNVIANHLINNLPLRCVMGVIRVKLEPLSGKGLDHDTVRHKINMVNQIVSNIVNPLELSSFTCVIPNELLG